MASINAVMPVPESTLIDAKKQYAEQYGSALVLNTYLKLALLCVSLVSLGAMGLAYQTYARFSKVQPLVIRINDVGRAEAVRYNDIAYKPQEAEFKYFLGQFVHGYYWRNRATVKEDFARSLFFLERQLAERKMDEVRKSKDIENVIVGSEDEVEVVVRNIIIHDIRTAPYRATVDYEKVYRPAYSNAESKREKYVGSVVFALRDEVPNNMIPINPLGIMITYFREDQAFGEEQR